MRAQSLRLQARNRARSTQGLSGTSAASCPDACATDEDLLLQLFSFRLRRCALRAGLHVILVDRRSQHHVRNLLGVRPIGRGVGVSSKSDQWQTTYLLDGDDDLLGRTARSLEVAHENADRRE